MDSSSPFQPWAGDDSVTTVKPEREQADDAKLRQENVNPKHTQTASYVKESGFAPSIVPGSSGSAESGTELAAAGKESKMDSAKISSMQQIVENTLSQEGRQRVVQLLEAVEALSGAERLLLYLRLPTGVPPHDPLKQPINPLGSRAELQQTVTWIQTHLEVDPDVSLPKQDVYDEYIAHCMSSNMKPLSTADFGKVMKQVYPTVRPRRLGTRGNSRYCYAGLRKKIKLEVPQLPDLGESSKEASTPSSSSSRENERIVCDWAEARLGVKFGSIADLSRHLASARAPAPEASPPAPLTPLPTLVPPPHHPPLQPHPLPHALPHTQPHPQHLGDDATNRQLMKQLKRKIQGTPGRPKKNKGHEVAVPLESPPGPSYGALLPPGVKHEGELAGDPYAYAAPYMPPFERAYPAYSHAHGHAPPPPRAHPAPAAPPPPPPGHEYRPDPYAFEPAYGARDLTRPAPEPAHNVPINLSSDASLDLSTERADWQRRRPPEPPPAPPAAPPRLPLPGKKLILEAYQSEQGRAAASADDFPCEYLPKKMRAAEIMGGKLAAARHAAAHDAPSTSAAAAAVRPEGAFLDDSKNLANRSTSTAAALAREEQEAASPTRAGRGPTPRAARGRRPGGGEGPDACCGLDGVSLRTGVICEEKHSEILNRERVISICNIDKHDLDDYLNEGNSQEHEEELLKYFQREGEPPRGHDHHHDDHSQGKSEKLSQLRELLAKNLKNQCGSNAPNQNPTQESQATLASMPEFQAAKSVGNEGAFRPVANNSAVEIMNGQSVGNQPQTNGKHCNTAPNENGMSADCVNQNPGNAMPVSMGGAMLYNGHHNEPQSPTTRTQQYDFVPISEGCHSPGFIQRGHSPTKSNKPVVMGGSLQTSPISHSTAASPFVSPRNTPVPRSRLCSRPIPKLNGRKRRNPLSLGVSDISKPFAIPNDQKFMPKMSMCNTNHTNLKYCQPMSAPPSPNIITSQYKSQMFQCSTGLPNGVTNASLNFLPSVQFRENVNGELAHPLSADPLSSEVSQFFQESLATYRPEHDNSFRSQSVPLKQGMNNIGLLSYGNTPVGSVPPTPVPNEFCDFGSLADTCDISKAGLNPETLDKIYDAIDSSNDVLNDGTQSLLSSNDALSNGCDPLPEPILADVQLNSFIPTGGELIDRANHFNHSYSNEADSERSDDVEEFLKRANRIEFGMSDLVTEKAKYYNTSRSVPSTPLPFKRASNLQIDPRRSRELFAAESYTNMSNGISSKSVPSTPQLVEERTMFSYSNRDFLINGNSVEGCGAGALPGASAGAEGGEALGSPLHDMDMLDAADLTPAADLLADLDKIDGTPYVDL